MRLKASRFKNIFRMSVLLISSFWSLNSSSRLLNVQGKFICVALPDKPFPPLSGFTLLSNGCFIGGSHIGNKKEALKMLDLAAEKKIKPWWALAFVVCLSSSLPFSRIQEMPMKDCGKAIEGMLTGKPRYRYVLTQDLV